MLEKVDSKVLTVVALVIGLIVGFVADNTLISRPRIESLTDQTTAQLDQITGLEAELEVIQNNYEDLQSQYEELEASSQMSTEKQKTEIEKLEEQIQKQNDVLNELQGEIAALEDEIEGLEKDYNNLQIKYEELYNPRYVAFEENGLQVNLTVRDSYYVDNYPVRGTITITYNNGAPFEGSFVLNLYKVHLNSGTTSEVYPIFGAYNYEWGSPFVLGPGSYRLYLSELKDQSGKAVITNSVLRNYRVYVSMG